MHNNRRQLNSAARTNPFRKMGMVKFFTISTLFYLTFPVSMLVALLLLGWSGTTDLLHALWVDFWQTIAVLVVVIITMVAGVGYLVTAIWN